MTDDAVTVLVINCRRDSSEALLSRFPQTMRAAGPLARRRLSHPESPSFVQGSSLPSILFALGHQGGRLSPIYRLTPNIVRQTRDVIYRVRHSGTRLHLVGVLDADSPYGARAILEPLGRLLADSGIQVAFHLGVWQATPSELSLGLRELASLIQPPNAISSIFLVDSVASLHGARRYVDNLFAASQSRPILDFDQLLPLRDSQIFEDTPPGEGDSFLIANHNLSGLDNLITVLKGHGAVNVAALTAEHQLSNTLINDLSRYRHTLVVSDWPTHETAFAGSNLRHPYYETLSGASAHHFLEMLISPHFGEGSQPYRTVVMLNEEPSPQFDWLAASFVRQNLDRPLLVCLAQPNDTRGNLVLSNRPFAHPLNYETLSL